MFREKKGDQTIDVTKSVVREKATAGWGQPSIVGTGRQLAWLLFARRRSVRQCGGMDAIAIGLVL